MGLRGRDPWGFPFGMETVESSVETPKAKQSRPVGLPVRDGNMTLSAENSDGLYVATLGASRSGWKQIAKH